MLCKDFPNILLCPKSVQPLKENKIDRKTVDDLVCDRAAPNHAERQVAYWP